jgi:phosphatidylglycerol:prolipoprotein diacylglycerol transferase
LLFSILWVYSRKPRPVGTVAGLFLAGYGVIRIFEEFFRQPDPQYGYLAFGWLTMGQILCLPMILFGLYLFARASKQPYEFCKV